MSYEIKKEQKNNQIEYTYCPIRSSIMMSYGVLVLCSGSHGYLNVAFG